MRTREDITNRIKYEDSAYANLSKGIVVLYSILSVVYVLLIAMELWMGSKIEKTIGGICYLIAMLNFVLFFVYYNKKYRFVDYGEPVLVMLKKARQRYLPFQKNALCLLPGLLLMDVGLTLNTFSSEKVLLVQAIYFGMMFIAVIIGYIYWFIRYKPLVDRITEYITELENG